MKIIRCYSDLIKLNSFEERFEYLKLGGKIGETTFGYDRWLNQNFYRTDEEYRKARREVILRDNGFDLGVEGHGVVGLFIVHHMNPITKEDIINRTRFALDPEFMISTSDLTHKAIHYGDIDLLPKPIIERIPNDTCPWRR